MSSNNVKGTAKDGKSSKENNAHITPVGEQGKEPSPACKEQIGDEPPTNPEKTSKAPTFLRPQPTSPITTPLNMEAVTNNTVASSSKDVATVKLPALPKKKVRLTAVEAAFKAIERSQRHHKKMMSRIFPPLLQDESKYGVLEKEVLENAKSDVEPGEERVMMWDPTRNCKVAGVAAPKRKNIHQYLMRKPFMQMYYGQDFLAKRDIREAEDRKDDSILRWNDPRNEVIVEKGEVPMCRLVRKKNMPVGVPYDQQNLSQNSATGFVTVSQTNPWYKLGKP